MVRACSRAPLAGRVAALFAFLAHVTPSVPAVTGARYPYRSRSFHRSVHNCVRLHARSRRFRLSGRGTQHIPAAASASRSAGPPLLHPSDSQDRMPGRRIGRRRRNPASGGAGAGASAGAAHRRG
jgi:hypothetical protein